MPLVEFHLIGRFLISQWHRDWSILAQFRFSNILLCNEGLDQVYPHHLDCLIVIYTVVYHTLGLLASKYYGCQISKVVFNSHTCTWLFFFSNFVSFLLTLQVVSYTKNSQITSIHHINTSTCRITHGSCVQRYFSAEGVQNNT